jgi:peptidoglycan DL-endopeptidase CwlO
MQKFALFPKFMLLPVIGALASTVTAAAMENPGAPSVKPAASMSPTSRGAAPSAANLAPVPLARSSFAASPSAMTSPAMTSPAMTSPATSPLGMSSLAASPLAASPTVPPNAFHSSMPGTANTERSLAPLARASAPNLSLSQSVQPPSSISASPTASTLGNTPKASMSPGTAAGLAAPGISHTTVAAQANLTTDRQAATSLRSPAMMASLAHTVAAAHNASTNKKGNVTAAMRPMSAQNISPAAKIRRQ